MSWPPSTQEGYLPYFLLFSSFTAITYSLVTYLSPILCLKQFSGPRAPPKTTLLAHVYGVKNVYIALIRFYAAYNIHNRPLYDLGIASFAGILFLYLGECFVWRTIRFREAVMAFVPVGLAFVWMVGQRGWYVGA
ncbi:hypothetical protein EYZ11_008326 [Aspergillus tanneri]|uniref:Ergosterol biosynthesis protein n=1 Tax=Aspergillus tanneri TaxID=1220188 RepID=A0A4S3JAQ2_9EURO|nr:uncharacterized protein ATNIH1004_000254 [Aspergillus tanneri]KAA8651372.1 hypothetical protein ATNIH1004_000254 [Aspergillus tanneri]THC92199.1 hypothetical protein EYZ11_008326 [Aspergillus tanneri]